MGGNSPGAEQRAGYGANLEHLTDEIERVERLVRGQLLRHRDAFAERERFWHLSDAEIERLLVQEAIPPFREGAADPEISRWLAEAETRRQRIAQRLAATRGVDLRLVRLAHEFSLTGTELDILLLAALPLLHSHYRRLFGALQYDAGRILPTVGFLTEVLARSAPDWRSLLHTLGANGKLAGHHLIRYRDESPAVPLPQREVLVDPRVLQFLLADDNPDASLQGVAAWRVPQPAMAQAHLPIPQALETRLTMLPELRAAEPAYFRKLRILFTGPDPGLAMDAFARVAAALKAPLLTVDLRAALERGPVGELLLVALREARLMGGLLFIRNLDALLDQETGAATWSGFARQLEGFPRPAALEAGSASTLNRLGDPGILHFHLPPPDTATRKDIWTALLQSRPEESSGLKVDRVAGMVADAFQLPAGQIEEAFAIARGLARRRNVFTVELTADDLFDACRRQSARQLIAFAQRIEPRAGLKLERVVLPPPNQRQLLDLQHRIRHHRRVFTFSGLGDRMRLGKGILALFVGGSGTGKTLAAEVLASEQKVDLYKVDLAAVTSKWLGETEKNLSRIFADAESSNAMLFFDEADALFGARGEIHEARDRWANLEVNFLLQRIEEYSGIVILATNLRQNLDEAFVRRINAFVDFPLPDSDSRYRIWKHLLPPAPGSAVQDTELNDLAGRFELAGGSIQNVVLDASYRALGCDPPVITLRHLIAGVTRESQKISRPITAVEFGERYYQWAIEDVLAPAATPGLATAVS